APGRQGGRVCPRLESAPPVPGELHELRRRGGERRPGHLHPRDFPDDRGLRQRAGSSVAIECEREGAADAPIVKRLFLVGDGDQNAAVPGALLHSELVAERTDEVVSLRRGEAAELYVGAPGADGGRLRGVIADEEGLVAVEIWLAAVPVFGVPAADPAHAFDMLDEEEGPCPHDVRLVPTDIALEDVGLVDPVPW